MSELVKYEDDPFAELAREAAPGRFLKFVQGVYMSDGEEVPVGTRCGAFVDQLAQTWVKFLGGVLVEKHVYFLRDKVKPPAREDLGDLDSGYWDRDKSGHPKDPWALQWLLPLQKIETGERLTFVTDSKGGEAAIRNLTGEYVQQRPSLPVIMLSASKYPNKRHGGYTHIPLFPVVGWNTPQQRGIAVAEPVRRIEGIIDPGPPLDNMIFPTSSPLKIEARP